MKIGVSVVYLDPKAGWVPGVVEDVTGFGEKTMVKIEGKKYGVDQVCEVMDKGVLGECPEDVMDLGMLHEGIVFCALRNVYLTGQCCTRLGKDIVIVVNPYTYKLPEGPLYDHKHYKKPPHHHPFSLARRAYKSLARASTSIVVTGESGAGKTETTKALLGYLSVKTGKEVRRRVMDAMLLLEVIGNAKTEKNDNSSRFGKYITLLFDGENHLKGAKLSTYLLEVSRVVSHGVLDRNFHVFYALLKGNEGIKTQLLGPDTRPQDFKCVNPGTTNLVRNVDDHENFKIITKSLNDLGVTHAVQITGFWSIVASIMHLLNITFRPAKRNDGSEVVDHVHVEKAATLLGVSPDGLLKTLTTTTMRAPGESEMITSGLSVVKAEATRNGIAKFLYKSLFDWVVSLVNEQLKPVGPVRSTTISLLDLFGFENFGENFLEQFLINYANESLQHHYNTQLFMAMTSACKAQSVSFKIAKHVSNAKCIDLIESRTGILRTLEDECALSGLKSSDSSYLEKLYASYTGPQGQRLNPYFNKPKVASEPWDFIVTHYAGDVRYKVTGSIEKNKHPVKDEVVKFLGSSGNEGTKRVVASNRSVSTTLLSREFKEELNNLLDVVAETETLWVRCVKPNTSKRPNLFEGDEVYRQLHCNGIVSTVKLLESGPQMTSFHTFTARYGCLYPPYTREASPRDQCLSIQHHLNIPQSDLQVGTLSDVFLTTAAYTKLTHLRESLKQNATDTLKRVYLGLLGRQEVFVEHAAREAIRLEEEKEAQLKRDEEAWTVVDNQRRKQEAFTAKQRAAGLKYASGRLATCARIEADRKAYYSKAHKQLSLWSRFVENDLTAWEGKEAQWSAKDAEADRIKAGIIKKHTETHQQRMDEIRQKAGEQAKLMETTKKREETVRRAAIEARKEQYRQRELLKKKEELRREEEAARRKALRDLKDSKLEADSEARYKQMLKKERAEKNSALRRETLAAQEEAYLQQQFRRKTRTASTGNTKQQWKTQQEIWSKMEVEEAQRYLSQGPQTDRVSPYASTIHRDVNETFGSYWGMASGSPASPDELIYTWTQLCYGEAPSARQQHQSSTIGGNKLAVVGSGVYRTMEVDPSATWSDKRLCGSEGDVRLLADLTQHCCCSDGDTLYLMGGWGAQSQKRNHDTYVIKDDTVEKKETTGTSPGGVTFSAAAWCSGSVYVFGGCTTEVTNKLWVLNEGTGVWSATGAGTAPSKRSSHTMTTVGDKLLVFGGKDQEEDALDDLLCFEAPISTWVRIDPSNKPGPRYGHTATAHKGLLYIFGGLPTADSSVYTLDLAADQLIWSTITTNAAPSPRSYCSFSVAGNKLCLFGGTPHATGTPTNELFMLDVASNELSDIPEIDEIMSGEEEEEEEEETHDATMTMTMTSTMQS